MGRAAGGDRQLSATLCLSRLLETARRTEPPRAQELGARQDFRQKGIGREPVARRIRQYRPGHQWRSEEHTSELQSLMRISYAVFCLKKKKKETQLTKHHLH